MTDAGSAPLVSVITPAFNAGRFIGATIESVQAQTHSVWEHIVVDDVSTDDTRAVVRRYAAADPRVRLIEQAENGGPGMARAAGLAGARGRYVAFIDSDDLWVPEKLERQLKYIAETGAGFVFTRFRRIDEDGVSVGRLIDVPQRLDYRDLLKNTAIVTSTVMLDLEVTGSVRSRKTFHDDFALWLDVLKRGVTAHGMRDDLARYRQVAASYSRSKIRMAYHVWRTYRDVEGLPVPDSIWCLAHYAWHGYWKYRRF